MFNTGLHAALTGGRGYNASPPLSVQGDSSPHKRFSHNGKASYKETKEKPTDGKFGSNKGCLHCDMQDRPWRGVRQGVQVPPRTQVEV